jgi:hypothetical protein
VGLESDQRSLLRSQLELLRSDPITPKLLWAQRKADQPPAKASCVKRITLVLTYIAHASRNSSRVQWASRKKGYLLRGREMALYCFWANDPSFWFWRSGMETIDLKVRYGDSKPSQAPLHNSMLRRRYVNVQMAEHLVGWIANSPRLLEVLVSSKREPCGSHGNWAGEGFSMRPIPLSASDTIKAQYRLFALLPERIITSAPGFALSIYAFFLFT